MPDTIVQIPTPEVIRSSFSTLTVATFAPWVPTFIRWIDTVGHTAAGMDADWRTDTHALSSLAMVEGRRTHRHDDSLYPDYDNGPRHLGYTMPLFGRWLQEQSITQPDVVGAVHQVDSPVDMPVVPIGPDHPGWTEWWDTLWDHAVESGYEEQYNRLAEALGGPEHEAEEHEYAVQVSVSLNVTVYVSAASTDDAYEQVEESMVDDAIREYIHSESVEWNIGDVEQND